MEHAAPRFSVKLPSGRSLAVGERTLIMGIVNVTPDSFSDGGLFDSEDRAFEQAERLLAEGADILDIGGESTRPGAEAASADQQIARVVPVIRRLRKNGGDKTLSVDTSNADVAERAFDAGADILNDVTALRGDPRMASLAARWGVPVVLMHMQGEPRTMQNNPRYNDVVNDIKAFLRDRIAAALDSGITEDRLMVDPGFGFGKTAAHNLEILRRLAEFHALGRPIVIGTSRKSTIGKITNRPVETRKYGTAATVALSVARRAQIVRVHDVAQMLDVARMAEAVERGAG